MKLERITFSEAKMTERYEPGTGSQAGFAYEAIRSDILCGNHKPDKKLKVHELAQSLSISPGAVREALFRLVSEQLVEARDQRGFAVTPVSITDLQELTDLRCEIESVACRLAVQNGGLEWESGLVAAQYKLRVTSAHYAETGEISMDFLSSHAAFHEALAAAAGNSRLLAIRSELYEQHQRFRAYYSHLAGRRHLAAEHDMLAELALARDADGLAEALVDHLSQSTRRIVEVIREG